MASQIPLATSIPFFTAQVALEGKTYTLQFRWNVRSQSAPAWQPASVYGPGSIVTNLGNVYAFGYGVFGLGGTSAVAGSGPTGQAASVLDGNITWQWLRESGSWFLDVLDSTGVIPILSGLRVVADWPLAKNNTGRLPPGVFVMQDTSGNGQDPGFDDLGARCRLVYFSAAELGL